MWKYEILKTSELINQLITFPKIIATFLYGYVAKNTNSLQFSRIAKLLMLITTLEVIIWKFCIPVLYILNLSLCWTAHALPFTLVNSRIKYTKLPKMRIITKKIKEIEKEFKNELVLWLGSANSAHFAETVYKEKSVVVWFILSSRYF